jgi:hypothetical protein
MTNNLSEHYLSNKEQAEKFGEILTNIGVSVSGSKLGIYELQGQKKVKVGNAKL